MVWIGMNLQLWFGILAECCVVATVQCAIVVWNADQIVQAALLLSRRWHHIVNRGEVSNWKMHEVLLLLNRIWWRANEEPDIRIWDSMFKIIPYEFLHATYRLKWITRIGGSLEMSNFLTAPRLLLQFGHVQPSIASPLKYNSKQSSKPHCLLFCGNSKLRWENPS